jgi:hypothetical protein
MAETKYAPTPVDSANLILRLYEERREEKMRKARDYMISFDPHTVDDYMAALMGPDSANVRMVLSYWEMAATLVVHGAIDPQMFFESTAEYVLMFSKVQPILPQIRSTMGAPNYLQNLEKICMSLPNAQQFIDSMRERIRAILAMRAAAAQKASA